MIKTKTEKEKLKLFKEKGYCLYKIPNDVSNEKKDVKYIENKCDQLRKECSKVAQVSEKIIEYKDFTLKNDNILYDASRVDIKIIEKLSDFVKVIANEKTNFNDSDHIYFRGHASTKYRIEPSIYRKENENILNNEDKLYRDLLSSKPHFFEECATTLERLVKMQHYGIPTRLLDLTDNPLIALYFACSSKKETNGEVLVFNIEDKQFKYFDSDTVAVLANLLKCSNDFDITSLEKSYNLEKSDNEKIDKFNKNTIISELVHYIREDKPYFLNKIDPKHLKDYTIVVKAKMVIDRMVSQSGAFILFGIDKTKNNRSNSNINKKGYKQKIIIIPAEYKDRIIKELRMFNINEATVFGDLDTISKYFTKKYK